MPARLIDGKRIAAHCAASLRGASQTSRRPPVRPPKLAVILIGEDPASQIYVRLKRADCAEVGMDSIVHELPGSIRPERSTA